MYSLKVLVVAVFVPQIYTQVSGSIERITSEFSRNLLHESLLNFLSGALHNFPSWVAKNKLDPFQLAGEFVTIKNTSRNITLTVTNQYVTGIPGITRIFNSGVSVGLDARSFDVSYATNDKISLGGDYEANGLYQGNISLNIRGRFSIRCREFWQGISVDNLTISDKDTYIHLHSGNITYSNIITFENVSFTNITFDKQNEELIAAINSELGGIYYSFVTGKVVSSNISYVNPSSRLLIRYINTLFWKTKVTDILNWQTVSTWDEINHSRKLVSNVFTVIFMLLLTSNYIHC